MALLPFATAQKHDMAAKQEDDALDADLRVFLITFLLHSTFTRKRWDRISVRQWINRLLLLFQRPLFFLVYRKERSLGRWHLVFTSHRDYAYDDEFEMSIVQAHHDQALYLLDGVVEPQEIPLQDDADKDMPSTYGILLAEPVDTEDATPHGPNVTYRLLDDRAQEYVLLRHLWNHLLHTPYSRRIGVSQRMHQNLEELFFVDKERQDDKGQLQQRLDEIRQRLEALEDFDDAETFRDARPGKKRQTKKAFADYQLNTVLGEGIVGNLYASHASAPLLSKHGKVPSNILFFLRFYGKTKRERNRKAFDDADQTTPYPYSLRLLIPENQKRDFRTAFDNMRQKSDQQWVYSYRDGVTGETVRETHDECANAAHREWFWSQIKRDNGIESFLNILETPFGEGTRALPDPAISSGFVYFLPGIFGKNLHTRLSKDESAKDIKNDDAVDLRRVVILEYLLSAISPSLQGETDAQGQPLKARDVIGSMTVPLRLASRTYMALVFTTVMKSQGDEIEQSHEHFHKNVFFFADIARHSLQRLRHMGKEKYLEQITDIFYTVTNDWLERSLEVDLRELEDAINERFAFLTRYWPFPRIQIEFQEGLSSPKTQRNAVDFLPPSFYVTFDIDKVLSVNPLYQNILHAPISRERLTRRVADEEGGLGFLSIANVRTALERASLHIQDRIVDRERQQDRPETARPH